jgi:hypothetical protein
MTILYILKKKNLIDGAVNFKFLPTKKIHVQKKRRRGENHFFSPFGVCLRHDYWPFQVQTFRLLMIIRSLSIVGSVFDVVVCLCIPSVQRQ